MNGTRDPHRLRELASNIPESLALALRPVTSDEPNPEQLDQVSSSLAARLGIALIPPIGSSALPTGPSPSGFSGSEPGLGATAGTLVSARAVSWWTPIRIATATSAIIAGSAIGNSSPVKINPALVPTVSAHSIQVEHHSMQQPATESISEQGTLSSGRQPAKGERISAKRAKTGYSPAVIASSEPESLPSAAPTRPVGLNSTRPAESELGLLTRAQASLATDPNQALNLALLHERQFNQGSLSQEREVIIIEALLRLGQVNEARKRGQAFRALFPGSAHARRVNVLLSGTTK